MLRSAHPAPAGLVTACAIFSIFRISCTLIVVTSEFCRHNIPPSFIQRDGRVVFAVSGSGLSARRGAGSLSPWSVTFEQSSSACAGRNTVTTFQLSACFGMTYLLELFSSIFIYIFINFRVLSALGSTKCTLSCQVSCSHGKVRAWSCQVFVSFAKA